MGSAILLISSSSTLLSISWESIHLASVVFLVNFPFEHSESGLSSQLTRAESQAATMVGVPQGFWHRSLCNSGKINVVVDTLSRKVYRRNSWNLQEQPLPMRIVVRLVLKVAPYGISLSKARCLPPHLLKACHELEMGIQKLKKKFSPLMIS